MTFVKCTCAEQSRSTSIYCPRHGSNLGVVAISAPDDILAQHYGIPDPVVHEGAAMLRPVRLNPPRFAPGSLEVELLSELREVINLIPNQPTTEQWQTIKNAIQALAPEPTNAA